MGIVEEDIAKVREATDMVGLVSERLHLKRVGTAWVGLCPFHAESTPSFNVRAEQGFYYCFGCHVSGDAISFVRELDGLDFVEAIELLAGRAGITLRRDDGTGGRDHHRRAQVYDVVGKAVAWYHDQLNARTAEASRARAYLRHERGYDGDVVRRYQLGWAPPGWEQLARAIGVPRAALVDAGLVKVGDDGRHRDFFRSRVLFPIFEPGGRAVSAGGRILPGAQGNKYMNTANTLVYDKSRTLYGLNWAKKPIVDRDRAVICEGYTDVIGMGLAGVGEAVATCGTALAAGHVRQLARFSHRLVLAYDADAAGQQAIEQFYEWEQRYELDIRVARLPGGSDPGSLARTDPDALRSAVDDARPLLEFRLGRLWERADLRSAEGRVRAAMAAVAMVDGHPSDLVRDQYLMGIADRCRIPPDRLRHLEAPPAGRSDDRRGEDRRPDGRQADGRGADGRHGDGRRPVDGGGDRAADTLGGPERQALLLAVHRPEEVAHRLEPCLFAHGLAVAAFAALLAAPTLHQAIDGASPQVADLLRRLAVEGAVEETDDVMVRLLEVAGNRARVELVDESRRHPSRSRDLVPELGWLKTVLESLRDAEHGRDAEGYLVPWLVARATAQGADPGAGDSGDLVAAPAGVGAIAGPVGPGPLPAGAP